MDYNSDVEFNDLGIPDTLAGDSRLSTLASLEDQASAIKFTNQTPALMVQDFGKFREELAKANLNPNYDWTRLESRFHQLLTKHHIIN